MAKDRSVVETMLNNTARDTVGRVWELYARFYDSLPRYYGPYQRLLLDVARAVGDSTPGGGRILDAGCGTGSYSIELGQRGYIVDGVDSSQAMLHRARLKKNNARLQNVEFKEWDIEKGLTIYPDNTFDCVLSVHVLFALREPENAISEYFRVLRPSGRFILAEPQHPVRIIPILKEIYRDGGLSNIGKLLVTQFGVGVCNLLLAKSLKEHGHHRWNEEDLRSKLEGFCFRVGSMVPAYAANSDLLATAIKPKCYFETNGYRFLIAETREDLEKVWKLRYQVYCVEMGYEPENRSGLERDVYDDHAANFLALDEHNTPVATMRMVADNPSGFPMDSDFPLTEYVRANGISRAVEGGRFAISKDLAREARHLVAFGLFKILYDYCNDTGIDDIFTVTQPKIVQKYGMPGVRPIGEPFEYSKPLCGGLWVPVHCNISQAYDNYLKAPMARTGTR